MLAAKRPQNRCHSMVSSLSFLSGYIRVFILEIAHLVSHPLGNRRIHWRNHLLIKFCFITVLSYPFQRLCFLYLIGSRACLVGANFGKQQFAYTPYAYGIDMKFQRHVHVLLVYFLSLSSAIVYTKTNPHLRAQTIKYRPSCRVYGHAFQRRVEFGVNKNVVVAIQKLFRRDPSGIYLFRRRINNIMCRWCPFSVVSFSILTGYVFDHSNILLGIG